MIFVSLVESLTQNRRIICGFFIDEICGFIFDNIQNNKIKL